MQYLSELSMSIAEITGIGTGTQRQILVTLVVLILAPLVQWLILAIIRRRVEDPTVVYRSRVAIGYTMAVCVIVILAFTWVSWAGSLATYLSIISAGLVIALQDSVSNLAGFIFIIWRKPFALSDRIEIGGVIGDVVDIRAFQFTVVEVGNWVDADQSTGRILHIPNSKIFKETIANYTTGFQYIWDEVAVLVTFESNWQAAKHILTDIAHEHCEHFTPQAATDIRKAAQRYMIVAGKLTPIVYTSVRDSGVLLTLRFLTHVRQRRGMQERIWEAVLMQFSNRDDIDFAYPSVRYYDNRAEGKPGAGGRKVDGEPG